MADKKQNRKVIRRCICHPELFQDPNCKGCLELSEVLKMLIEKSSSSA